MAINLFQLNPAIAMILINLVPDMRARLLNVCNLFSGKITPTDFGFKDEKEFVAYHKKCKLMLNFVFHSIILANTFTYISASVLFYLKYNLYEFLIFGLPWMVLNYIVYTYITTKASLVVCLFFINCLYMRPKIGNIRRSLEKALNLNVLNPNMFMQINACKFLRLHLIQLDSFYQEFNHLNGYWKYYICSVYFTMIPASLLVLDLLFFEDVNLLGIINYSCAILTCAFYVSANFLSASLVSDQQLALYCRFNSIMTKVSLPLRLKYQLMLTIERLGCLSYPHQMGFTCHKFFTVDNRVMKDSLLYCLGLFLLIRGVSVSLNVDKI
jgi:hypothetical protein